MSEAFGDGPFPRAPLVSAATLIVAAVLLVVWVRVTGIGAVHVPDAASVAARELRFADQPDGSIAVYDATSSEPVDVITGANGFLRGTLRGLARERKREGVGQEQPFLLTARADGRLGAGHEIHDPADHGDDPDDGKGEDHEKRP